MDNVLEICNVLDGLDDPSTPLDDENGAEISSPDGPVVQELCDAIAAYEAAGGSGPGLAGFDLAKVKTDKAAGIAEACKHRRQKIREKF